MRRCLEEPSAGRPGRGGGSPGPSSPPMAKAAPAVISASPATLVGAAGRTEIAALTRGPGRSLHGETQPARWCAFITCLAPAFVISSSSNRLRGPERQHRHEPVDDRMQFFRCGTHAPERQPRREPLHDRRPFFRCGNRVNRRSRTETEEALKRGGSRERSRTETEEAQEWQALLDHPRKPVS